MFSPNPLAMWGAHKPESISWKWVALVFAVLSMLAGVAIAYLVGKTGLLAVLIISIMILVIIAVIYPELALFGLLFVIYINLSDVLIEFQGIPSIARPLVVGVFGIILIRAAVFKDPLHGWKSFVLLAVLYGLVGVLAMLIAADYEQISLASQDYLKDVFIGLEVILLIRTPKNLRHAVWILLLAGLLMGCFTLYQQITGTLEDPYWGFGKTIADTASGLRMAGPIGDPNTYAQIMAVLIPLALERVWNERKSHLRLLAMGILFLCGFTVVYTYSRGAFVAVTVALLFMAILRPLRPAIVVGAGALLIFIFQLLPSSYVERISTLFYFLPSTKDSVLQDRSFRGRSSENLVATMMFKDHPLIGVGAGNFNANYQDYSRRIGRDPRRDPRSAHSLYLEVASERGLLGLLVFFLIVGSAFWSLWRAEKRYSEMGMREFADLTVAISSGLTAYLIAALFLHDSYIRYFWVLIGIAWAAATIADRAYQNISKNSGIVEP